jgi:hypothetical protein
MLVALEAAVPIGPSVEAQAFLDRVQADRDAEAAGGASWYSKMPNLGISDLGKKISEGADSMVAKFSGENSPFKKLASGAQSFFGLGGPSEVKKTGVGALTDVQRKALYDKPTGDATAAQVNAAQAIDVDDKSYLVTLTDDEQNQVIFEILPEIIENRSVEYEAVQPPQFPGAFQKYKGTSSVQWSVNAIFVCRTTAEATRNLEYINRLRGWTMPYFGEFMAQSSTFKDKVGAPPPVLIFQGLRTNIVGPVPVVITSLNWNWPRDVDYIPASKLTDSGITENGVDLTGTLNVDQNGATVPFPAVISVAIQLVESFSPAQFNGFNLGAYRVGDFKNAYGNSPRGSTDTTESDVSVTQTEQGEEAQAVYPGPLRGLRSDALPADPNRIYPNQTTLSQSVGAGRGVVNPPLAAAMSEAKKVLDTSWRGRGERGVRWTTKI